MDFLGCRFPTKNEQNQVDLRYHSIKVEFVRSFFGGDRWPKKPFSKLIDLQLSSKTIRSLKGGNITNILKIET